ncbi:hypothetical protein Cus16_0632 [Curtobacterium sp. ER1/6]|nr:hypothetical protein Cus16_0632 [Curtobacterium sp. ER1/6]
MGSCRASFGVGRDGHGGRRGGGDRCRHPARCGCDRRRVLAAVDVRQRPERSFQVPLGVGRHHAGRPGAGALVRGVDGRPVAGEQGAEQPERAGVEARGAGRSRPVGDDPAELHDERRVRSGLARHRAVAERGCPPGDAHRPQQVGVEGGAHHVLPARQRPERADEQQVLLEPGVRLAQPVRGLDHRTRGRVRAVVRDDLRAVRPEALGLGDDVERPALVELGVDDHERLEARPELRGRPPHALRDGADLAVLPGEHRHDAVRLTELVGAQHDALVPVQRHVPSIPRAADSSGPYPRRVAARPVPSSAPSRAPACAPSGQDTPPG